MIFPPSAAIFAPLLLLLCLIQVVAASQVACQKDPVIVYLDRGQKVTISYWLGQEARHEVTELPKPSRRPTLETKESSPYTTSSTPYYSSSEPSTFVTLEDEENLISQRLPLDQQNDQREEISSTTAETTSTFSDPSSPSSSETSTHFPSSTSSEGTNDNPTTKEPQNDISSTLGDELSSSNGIISNTANDINNDAPALTISSSSIATEKAITETISTTPEDRDKTSYSDQESTVSTISEKIISEIITKSTFETSPKTTTEILFERTSEISSEITSKATSETTSEKFLEVSSEKISDTTSETSTFVSESESPSNTEINSTPETTVRFQESISSSSTPSHSEKLSYDEATLISLDDDLKLSTPKSSPAPFASSSSDSSISSTPETKSEIIFNPFSEEEYVDVPEEEQSDATHSDFQYPPQTESVTLEIKSENKTNENLDRNILTTFSSLFSSFFTTEGPKATEDNLNDPHTDQSVIEEELKIEDNEDDEMTRLNVSAGFSVQLDDNNYNNDEVVSSLLNEESENFDFEVSSEPSLSSKLPSLPNDESSVVPSELIPTGLGTSTGEIADETIRNDVTIFPEDITKGEKELSENEINIPADDVSNVRPQLSIDNIINKTLPVNEVIDTIEDDSKSNDKQATDRYTQFSNKDSETTPFSTLTSSDDFSASSTFVTSNQREDLSSSTFSPNSQESNLSSTPVLFLRPNDKTLMETILHQVLKENSTDSDDDVDDIDVDDNDDDDEDDDDDLDEGFDNGGEVGVEGPVSDKQPLSEEEQEEEGVEPEEKVVEEVEHDEGVEIGHHEAAHTSEPLEFSTHASTAADEERTGVQSDDLPPTKGEGEVSEAPNENLQEQDVDPSAAKPKTQYSRVHPKLRPQGPRIYHSNRWTREAPPHRPNATSCTWVFKTEPGVPFLLTLKNYSLIEGDRCLRHHVAVERSNGYEARWCGETNDVYKHSTFARHEVRLRFYTENSDLSIPEGFVVEVQALDMNLLRKAVSKVRPLFKRPKIT